ncbi:MAG: flagellar assembly protein FliW [Treponemataceae bacterium]|nr:flagellar assembly protein FliW [Treponemataceae bacterium]
MEIKTRTMGTVNVTEDSIYSIPDGLFGFEEFHSFAMIQSEHKPFMWFQSIENSELSFLLIDPFLFCQDYEVDVDDESLKSIGITSPEDVQVMAIVTLPADGSAVTANLQGPLIFNRKNNKCIQIISCDSRWATKHNILEELKRGKKC